MMRLLPSLRVRPSIHNAVLQNAELIFDSDRMLVQRMKNMHLHAQPQKLTMTALPLLVLRCAVLLSMFSLSASARSVSRLFEEDFLPSGAPCTRGGPFDYPRCSPGLWCLRGVCTRRGVLGDACSEGSECGSEMRCSEAGLCVPDPIPAKFYARAGAQCKRNAFQRCAPGLWCIASVCRRLVRCGGRCDGKTQVCRPGLACSTVFGERGLRLCRRVAGTLKVHQQGDACLPNASPRCRTGLRCVVRDSQGTCRPPVR
eukprot:IDg15072t1